MVLNTVGASIVPVGGGLSNVPALIDTLDTAVRGMILRRDPPASLLVTDRAGMLLGLYEQEVLNSVKLAAAVNVALLAVLVSDCAVLVAGLYACRVPSLICVVASPTAASPAISPSITDRRIPPMPVISPAAASAAASAGRASSAANRPCTAPSHASKPVPVARPPAVAAKPDTRLKNFFFTF